MIADLKTYPATKESGAPWLGKVPTCWAVRRLKTTAKLVMGQSPLSEDCSNERIGLPFLQGCAEFGNEIPAPVQFCRAPARVSPRGALLLSVRAPVGKVNRADRPYGIGRGLCAIVPMPKLNTTFAQFMLGVASAGLTQVATGSTYDAVSIRDIGSLLVAQPPLSEQTAIARFLNHATGRIERYIRSKEKLIALLEEQKQVIVHDAVMGRIDVCTGQPYPAYKPSGMAWLGDLPDHWEVVRNGRLFAQRNEVGFSELPILEVSLRSGVRVRDFNYSNRKQAMSDRGMYKRAVKSDIAYNMMRMWQGAVGVAPVDGLVSPAYVVAKPLEGTEPRYFDHLFHTSAYMIEVDKHSRGIVKDRNRLYWEDFKQMATPCPPSNEQVLIADAIDRKARSMRAERQNARRQITLANECRTRLIADVVTGKIDVREAAAKLPELDSGWDDGGGETIQAESMSQSH